MVWGISMMAFSICFVVGTLFGGWFRYSWAIIEVPWESRSEDVPKTPREAWLWISFASDALSHGVAAKNIKEVYRRAKETGGDLDLDNVPWPSFTTKKPAAESTPGSLPEAPPPHPGPSPR
jgi:hypothetical protein